MTLRPTAHTTLAIFALLGGGLVAGCAGPGGAPAGAEAGSGSGAASDDAVGAAATDPSEGNGGLAGVVVDEAVRPIAGARVTLPDAPGVATTDRSGRFAFGDVPPGSHFLHAEADGFEPATALAEVAEGRTATVRLLLVALPPDGPRHVTLAFDGFAEVTDVAWAGFLLYGYAMTCSACQFTFELDPAGLHTIVTEAAMAPGPAESGFEQYFKSGDGSERYSYALGGNPFRTELGNLTFADDGAFYLAVSPWSWPAPELDKRFQVFVTAFYNAPPPPGWSALEDPA